MKNGVLMAFVILFVWGCSEDKRSGPGLVGKWVKVGEYYSIGGPTTYKEIVSTNTLEFFDDGTFKTNASWCGDSKFETGSYSIDRLTPKDCGDFQLSYALDGDDLIVRNLLCIEGCGEKFKKVD